MNTGMLSPSGSASSDWMNAGSTVRSISATSAVSSRAS
jgi:hypothetical protein